MQFVDVGAGGGPLNGTRVVHHVTDELLIQQNTIPDGKTASPIQGRSQRSQSLCRFLSHLIDMFRPGEPFIKGHPKITGVIDPLDWLPEQLYRSALRHAPTGFGEEHVGALRDHVVQRLIWHSNSRFGILPEAICLSLESTR